MFLTVRLPRRRPVPLTCFGCAVEDHAGRALGRGRREAPCTTWPRRRRSALHHILPASPHIRRWDRGRRCDRPGKLSPRRQSPASFAMMIAPPKEARLSPPEPRISGCPISPSPAHRPIPLRRGKQGPAGQFLGNHGRSKLSGEHSAGQTEESSGAGGRRNRLAARRRRDLVRAACVAA
jgi:hypothetical protein